MSAYTLSGAEAGGIAARVRLLRRQRLLTAYEAALADVMLWTARKPGSACLTASLAVLARLAGQARSTATAAVRRLEELGLIQRIRRRVRMPWHGGRTASRQVANAYRLIALATETAGRPGREQSLIISVIEAPIAEVKAAREVLAQRQKALEQRWLARRTGVGPYSCIGA
jgi:hypothetical protein